jgi:hypothetical protein
MATAIAKVESRERFMALLARERDRLDDLKARMAHADSAERQAILRDLLMRAVVETHGTSRKKTATVTFSWAYAVDSSEELGFDKSRIAGRPSG